MEQYQHLFRSLKRSGYDVITFDNAHTTIEQKLFMLNEFCDCVITYEGGLALMAHVLKIPSIILPWHHSPEGTELKGDWCSLYYQSIHLSKNTWFVESVSELLSWSPEKLKEVIDLCHDGKGNNLFFAAEQITIFENLSECRLHLTDRILKFKLVLTAWEKEFIKSHIPNRNTAHI